MKTGAQVQQDGVRGILRGRTAGADWERAVEEANPGEARILRCSWAQVEPERGKYDDGVLERYRRAVQLARRRKVEPILCLHSGALPDWQLQRGGWMDPDGGATWGCFVDVVARQVGEMVGTWLVLDGLLAEAEAYGPASLSVARTLLDVHASAYLLLHRSSGYGGRPCAVGSLEEDAHWVGNGLRGRMEVWRRSFRSPESVVEVLATGRLRLPFSPVGELPNGTPALDVWGLRWGGVRGLPEGTRQGDDEEACLRALRGAWKPRRPLLLFGVSEPVVKRLLMEGVRVELLAD